MAFHTQEHKERRFSFFLVYVNHNKYYSIRARLSRGFSMPVYEKADLTFQRYGIKHAEHEFVNDQVRP